MASKQRADRQKEKEKKEKIILLVLVAVLVIVGAFELPKMLGGSSGSTVSAGQTTSTSSATSAGGTPTSTSAAIGSLPNSSGYKANAGQLSGFSLFNSRDPFGSVATSSSETTTTPSTKTTSTKTTSTKTNSITAPQGQYVAARISINGVSEDVALNATFPSASPVFVLSSLSAKKIKISVAGGSFSSGQSKVEINKGKSVALVNTVDSTRYAIKFITALTASQASSSTSGTTAGGTTAGGTTTSSTTASTTTGSTS
jgi:flagellar basal body-associated protein FliL